MTKFLLVASNIKNLYKEYNNVTIVLAAITLADSVFKMKS
jgi:hypothetical protein